jgi:nitrous oxidase accessory protein NosD
VAATFTVDDDGITFRTSDATPPAGRVGMARDNFGIRCHRDKVTISGIRFENYLAGTWAAGVLVQAADVVIRDCHTWNARAGFFFYGAADGTRRCRLEQSRADDVGCGVYCMGEDVDTIDCRFSKRRDSFMVHGYWQDDTGIQYYAPSRRGTVRGNLVKGFNNGIYIKCPDSFYLVEHNTVINADGGLYRSSNYSKKSRYVHNIIADVSSPFLKGHHIKVTVVDRNCLWAPKDTQLFMQAVTGARRAGFSGNIIADPRFADSANDDYRLLPDSPCATLAGDARPWGAFPVVPADFRDEQPPGVSLTLAPPAAPAGSSGTLHTEMDPWIGGQRTLVKTLFAAAVGLDYIVPSTALKLEVIAEDAGKPAHMQLRFNDAPWPEPSRFNRFPKVRLPDADGPQRLQVRVADEAGNWSEPAVLIIARQQQAPAVQGTPTVYDNAYGAVISFRTDQPGFSHVEYGPAYGLRAAQPDYVHRDWRVMDGADWVEHWQHARTEHHVPIIAPALAPGSTVQYRIVTRDAVGNTRTSEGGSFTLAGAARTLVVATTGTDADGRGDAATPLRTIAYALARTLPGDTVLVEPGVYAGEVYIGHGGTADAPITLRSREPLGAVLDGVRKVKGILRLEAAPHIVVDGFDIRWFHRRGCGIYAADSPSLTVSRCKIWNMEWSHDWGEGVGIFLHRSPDATLRENVLLRAEQGVVILQSPRTRVLHNTALRNTYGAVAWSVESAPGSVMAGNSFCYNGNDQVYFETLDDNELETFVSDRNNFGTVLGKSYRKEGRESLAPPQGSVYGSGSKAILRINGKRFYSMADWRQATGWDANSIFAHPGYVDVRAHDFRVAADSPNAKAGPDGTVIGASGIAAD